MEKFIINNKLINTINFYYYIIFRQWVLLAFNLMKCSFLHKFTWKCGTYKYNTDSVIWPTVTILKMGHILKWKSGPHLFCHLKEVATSATSGPCSVYMLHASADWMPLVPVSSQMWAKCLCYVGTWISFFLLRLWGYLTVMYSV